MWQQPSIFATVQMASSHGSIYLNEINKLCREAAENAEAMDDIQNCSFSLPIMTGRFSTPPRRAHALVQPSLVTSFGETTVIVTMVNAFTGANIGQMTVTKATRLFDIRSSMVAAMGGGNAKHEIYLLDEAGTVHDKAFSCPFTDAQEGHIFRAVMVQMDDMVYLDMNDRRK